MRSLFGMLSVLVIVGVSQAQFVPSGADLERASGTAKPRSTLKKRAPSKGAAKKTVGEKPQGDNGSDAAVLQSLIERYSLRTWKAAHGDYKVVASMLELKDGRVVLKKEEGGEVSVPLEKLSDGDQRYAKIWGNMSVKEKTGFSHKRKNEEEFLTRPGLKDTYDKEFIASLKEKFNNGVQAGDLEDYRKEYAERKKDDEDLVREKDGELAAKEKANKASMADIIGKRQKEWATARGAADWYVNDMLEKGRLRSAVYVGERQVDLLQASGGLAVAGSPLAAWDPSDGREVVYKIGYVSKAGIMMERQDHLGVVYLNKAKIWRVVLGFTSEGN